MRRWLTLCMLMLPVLAYGQYAINGDDAVCPAQIKTYTVTGTPAPITFQWSVTGGNIMSVNYGTATVVWGGAGSGAISVVLLDAGGNQIGNPSLAVTISAIPDPVLTTSFDNECVLYEEQKHGMPVPIINNDDCWHVCELSTVHYYVSSSNPNSAFTWNVTGATGFTQLSTTEIEVYWGGPGQGAVSVTEITPEGCEATTSKCIIVIESPRAIITVTPQNADCREGGTLTVCLNQLLNFNGSAHLGNSNSPIVAWLWDFGDGTFSTAQNTTHQWTTPGTYYVTLTVTNACNCTGTCTLEVVVDPVEGVNIECVTPVCARDTGHYRTDAICNTYLWTAVNGTIIGGQGTSQVTVVWNDGSQGNGILCLDNTNGQCPNYCPSVTCVDIPIIADPSSISGPAIVCVGSQVKYSVPSMTGSIYTWSLANGNGNGMILFGQGTNEILVQWNQTGSDVVTVDYENQLLECGGRAELNVEISTGFSISGPDKACPGSDVVFTADNPQNIMLDWTVTDSQNNSIYLGSGTGVPDFTVTQWPYGSGIFVITASDPAQPQTYCNASASYTIEISSQPPPPPLPEGDELICPGKAYFYTCTPASANYYLQWTITEGIPPAATGTQVTVYWNHSPQNPYMISIVQVETGTGCTSEPTDFPVFVKQYVEPVITENVQPGPFLHCINSTHTFEISNAGSGQNDYKYDYLEWIIKTENRGSVTANQGTTSVDVQWNNTTSPLPLPPMGNEDVYLQVKTYLCGFEYYEPNHYQSEPPNVYLTGSLPVSIIPDNATVCEWEQVNFSFNPPIPNGVYQWDFGNGQNSNAQNPVFGYNLPPGAGLTTYPVTLTVNDLMGCEYNGSTYITVLPEPPLGISTTSMSVCNSTADLTALSIPGVTYLWSTGQTTQQITISSSGAYSVTVTDGNGCTNDEMISISGCAGGPGNSCPLDPNLSINFTFGSNCNIVDFSTTYSGGSGTPVNWDWEFGNGQSSSVQNPGPVTYNFAGTYLVSLKMETDLGICLGALATVVIKAVPDFKVTLSCPNGSSGGNYVANFVDYTTYAYPLSAYTWSWSDAQSSWTDNVREPVAYFNSGAHAITLIISDGNNPVCHKTKTIIIPQPPNPAFTISAGPYCEEQTVVHFSASNTSVIHALWDFGDASSYAPPNPSNTIDADRVFAAEGTPTITLTLTDYYGCTYSSQQSITVNDNGLDGEIVSPSPFCPGDGGVFEFVKDQNAIDPTGWLWSTGATTQTITVYQTGLYWVTVSHAPSGCTFTPANPGNAATINVPQPVIRGDLLLCEGEYLSLDGNQGTLPAYTWAITPAIAVSGPDPWTLTSNNPMQTGTYHVTLTLIQNGCSLTTEADVTVNPLPPPPVIQSSVPNACEGQPIQLTVTNAGNNWINWSNGMNGPLITVHNANLYQATMTDGNGCTSTNTFEVHPNPYTGFMTTGCLTYCDTIDITLPGSAPVSYAKWTWYVNGTTQPGWTGVNSPVAPLPLGQLSPGVYVVTLHLVVQYPDLTECDIWTDPLEITVVTCPCHLEPSGRIYCMEPIPDDSQGPFNYHFEIFTGYQCSGNPSVQVTAQNGAVTLLPWNNPPGYITGILSTSALYPDHGCIELTITDPLTPECNCHYIWCEKLPRCPYGPADCEFGLTYGELFCIGFDANGHPIYQFQINITTANPLHATWLAQGVTLAGFPVMIPAGTNPYTVTVTAPPASTGFCIHLQAYDFVTHRICLRKICINSLPGCEVPTRAVLPVTPVSGKPVFTTPSLQASLHLIPNPASDEVSVYYLQPSAGMLSVITPDGKEVTRMALNDFAGQVTLNLNDYPPGIYLVSLKPDGGNALFRKLAVIR